MFLRCVRTWIRKVAQSHKVLKIWRVDPEQPCEGKHLKVSNSEFSCRNDHAPQEDVNLKVWNQKADTVLTFITPLMASYLFKVEKVATFCPFVPIRDNMPVSTASQSSIQPLIKVIS